MVARSKKRKLRKQTLQGNLPGSMWMEQDGMHALIPDDGLPPDLEALSRSYQDKIRKSALWDTMVAEYGLEKAEQLLKEFKVELKP